MPISPEDNVQVVREYFPEHFDDVRKGLPASLTTNDIIDVNSDADEEVVAVNKARKSLRTLLFHDTIDATRLRFGNLYEDLRHSEAKPVSVDRLDEASHAPDLKPLSAATIKKALTRKALKYTVTKPHPNNRDLEITLKKQLLGYAEDALTNEEVAQLVDLNSFMRGEAERAFRLGLLRAETEVLGANFDAALALYQPLMMAHAPGEPRRKFLAIRAGLALNAKGAQLYRRTRDLASETIAEARASFQQAIDLMAAELVESERRIEIVDTATAQRNRIDAKCNALGFQNRYIPKGPSFEVFGGGQGLARTRINEAIDARNNFGLYLAAFEDTQAAEAQAAFAANEAARDAGVAALKANAAGIRERAATGRKDVVDRLVAHQENAKHIDLLNKATNLGFESVKKGGVFAFPGIADFALRLDDERNELAAQQRQANLEALAALVESSAATLEQQSADARAVFLELQRDQLVDGGRLNAATYYDLAFGFERLLDAHTSRAAELAFLAERRAVFELGEAAVPQLDFGSIDTAPDKILAPSELGAYLTALQTFVAVQQPQEVFTEFDLELSLKDRYPVEFARFLETGVLPFQISLPELDALRPGTTKRRVRSVKVLISGLVAPLGNVSARLKHTGLFMLRDGAETAKADRLMPKAADMVAALEKLQTGAESVVALGGITLWQVEPTEKELTSLNDDESIEEFAHYGIAGLWEFEMLQSENPDINITQISNINLFIEGKCLQGDDSLRTTVRRLLKEHRGTLESDHTVMVSMRNSPLFDEAFKQLTETKQCSFALDAATFLADMAGATVKAFVLRAEDEKRKGLPDLTFVVGNEHTSAPLQRTTRADGFSEDLSDGLEVLEPADRFALEGVWTIDGNGNQLQALHDLVLVFLYHEPIPVE